MLAARAEADLPLFSMQMAQRILEWVRMFTKLTATLLIALGTSVAWAGRPVQLVSTDYPPYFASDLPEYGTLSAIARAAFKASGHELTIVFRPWARVMKEVEAGEHDGVVAVWYKAERESFLTYSAPLVDTQVGFYGRTLHPIDVSNLKALQGRTIGTVRGYANPLNFEAAQLKHEDVTDDISNLRKLLAGRVDLIVIERALAHWLIQKEMPSARNEIGWLTPPLQTMPLYVGIALKRPDSKALLNDFNRGLAEIQRNGEYARILKRLPLTPD